MRFLEHEGRVDAHKGVLYSVRVCGPRSDNGRVYTAQCLREALGLLDGMKVRCNHPKNPTDTRSTSDTLGWLSNPRQGKPGRAATATRTGPATTTSSTRAAG
jgi:hypothetical protein